MADLKKIGMAACTFSVALGIGFVMQNGDALASRFGTEAAPDAPAPFSDTDVVGQSAPPQLETVDPETGDAIATAQAGFTFNSDPDGTNANISSAVIVPEAEKVPPAQDDAVQLATLDAGNSPVEKPAQTVSAELDCVPTMTAVADVAATVTLSLAAPCHASEPVTIHHQGMMFTAMTDEEGGATLTVPALAEVAVMIAAFEDGDGAVATKVVPDFANYDRAVLQWEGDASLMLSAYEGDANFGDEGHIYMDNPGGSDRLNAAEGGYMVRLGDISAPNPLIAEVYTFPTQMIGAAFDVMLVAEAEITAQNCGQEMAAQSLQVSPTGQTSALDLTMIMPACDAVGDFLILQNMFEDLTLASR